MSRCDCSTNCDCYAARAFRRVRSESQFWEHEHVRLTGRIAQLETEIKLRDHRDRTDVAWLQGKVVAQAKEIKRLNDEYNANRLRNGIDPVPDVQPEHASIDDRMEAFRNAEPGSWIVARKSPRGNEPCRQLKERKDTGDGWWLTDGSGLSDWAYGSSGWRLLDEAAIGLLFANWGSS